MRTAAAYISKLKAQALGRNFKVQDTNHRAFTSTLYRGAAGCGPVNYTQLNYVEVCKCDYIGPAKRFNPSITPNIPVLPLIYDGGTPSGSGPWIIDGGSVISGGRVVDGGIP
jgi:hypothetical protein